MRINDIVTESLRTDNPCWDGYKPVGTKKKAGKTVPNCVPVDEAAIGFPHRVRYTCDDPSGAGIASGHYTVNAPDKIAAARYTVSDLTRKGKKNVQIKAVTPQKQGVGEAEVVGDTEQDQELRKYAQDTADMAKQELKNKMPAMLSKPGEQDNVHEDWQSVNKHDKTDGMSKKAVSAYRRENPGSKLKTAVTTKPSKLKAGSKDAKRRKSFCARMSGVEGPMKDEKGRPTAKAKALSRWNC